MIYFPNGVCIQAIAITSSEPESEVYSNLSGITQSVRPLNSATSYSSVSLGTYPGTASVGTTYPTVGYDVNDASGGIGKNYSNAYFPGNYLPSVTFAAATEGYILKKAFSNVPLVEQRELDTEYSELGVALKEMTELDVDEEFRIDEPVYDIASYVAAELMDYSLPAPKVFSHGPKSVVFTWLLEGKNIYLTISSDKISSLISTPERILQRAEYSANQRITFSAAMLSVKAISSGQSTVKLPVTSDPLEQ